MKKKIAALALAMLMVFTMLPFAAFAADDSAAAARVAAWEANYELVLAKLQDAESYAHYKYVIDNNKEIKDMMTVYTVFGLYDDAWKNGVTKKADVDTCKKVLVSMIEEQAYDMGKDYSEDILKVLDGAQSANDLIQKIQGITGGLDFVKSETWGTVFKVISTTQDVLRTWQDIKAGFIKAMTEILSVQYANAYYLDMLAFVAEDTAYAPMATAANQLIEEATTAINEQILAIAQEALDAPASNAAGVLITLALDSNVYTATAKKVYDAATTAADYLWNTGDQYAIYSALTAAFYAEVSIDKFADAALAGDDADAAIFAVNALISTRSFGEDAMYNLKLAQADGIIGKIKSKVNNAVFTEYTASQAELELMKATLIDADVADMAPVNKIAKVYCPVNVAAGDLKLADGAAATKANAIAAYSTYNKEYIKVLFIADAATPVKLTATSNGYVTYVEYVLEDGAINDASFTEQEVAAGTVITVTNNTYNVVGENVNETKALNDTFVVPEGKTPTAKDVANAVVEVGKDEANNFLAKIKAFFENLFASLKNIFSFFKK